MTNCGNVQKVFLPVKEKDIKEMSKTPSKEKPTYGISITDLAAEKIYHFLKIDNKDPETHGLYVSVVKDGCSGNSYNMALEAIQPYIEKGDKLFTHNRSHVIIDKLSYMFITGSILDYQETLLFSGFQLRNPNVKKSCSCGSSVAF